jgi:DNA-binding NarL/FixJ family response regulator
MNAKAISVIIVEDSEIVRTRLAALLSQVPGVAIAAQARDGLQALSLIAEHRPQAVLLDIELPGLNGLKLLESIKRDYPACGIIVLTTYAFAEFRRRCEDLGADHFLDKSMDFERIPALLTAMREALVEPHPNPA